MALILSRADVQRCLDMNAAIEAMRTAFGALHAGFVRLPQRSSLELEQQGVLLLMPSLLETSPPEGTRATTRFPATPPDHSRPSAMEATSKDEVEISQRGVFALKMISVMPGNPQQGMPRSYASVILGDAAAGKTLAILEGGWLTAMRTGAASGLATELLARRDADVLALFGAGAQAPFQALGVATVRPLREVRVVNRSEGHYRQLVATLRQLLGAACPPVRRAASAQEALAGASIVACATASMRPLFAWNEVEPGTHINAIGAFTPEMCEVDGETLAHARLVIDQREAALAEAGDLLQAQAAGLLGGPETWIELGELLAGTRPGRQSATEVTVFKSVGVAAQDAAAAWQVYCRAREIGVGVEVEI